MKTFLFGVEFSHGLLLDCFVLKRSCDPVIEGLHANIIDALLGYAAQPLDLLSQNRINTHSKHYWLAFFLDCYYSFASLIPQQEREELVAALTKRLAAVEPFEVLVGSMLSYHSGVIADLHPDGELTALHQAVRETIRSVRGDDAVRYPWKIQRLTIGYAHSEADSDQAQRLLRRVRPSHAPLYIYAVHLVDVTHSDVAKTITWDHVAAIPLGPSRSADSL